MYNPLVRDNLFGSIDSIFGELARPSKYRVYTGQVNPKANISKDESGYQISMAAPGLSRSDFNIEITDNVLTISSENGTRNENSLRREYSYDKFSRSWSLPETANVDSVTADYEAGILKVNIPVEDVTINKTKKIEVN